MRGALISGLSCATCSASARRAGCRIAGRPSWPRFWRSCAPPDAGWSRFPHGTYPGPLCSGVPHQTPPSAIPQRRPLSPRAVRTRAEQVAELVQRGVDLSRLIDEHVLRGDWVKALVQDNPQPTRAKIFERVGNLLAQVN